MITARKELHDQIWSRPMTKVAAEYGVTSTALKKTCIRHEVPTPERGYWAKLQHGKPVAAKLALPSASAPHLEEVHIVGAAGSRLPNAVQEAKATARQRMVGVQPASPSIGNENDAPAEHPTLLPTRRAIGKARPDARGFASVSGRGIVPLTISPNSSERCLRVLSSLLSLAEAQGYVPRTTDSGLVLAVDGEPVAFGIDEQTVKSPHVLTRPNSNVRRTIDGGDSRSANGPSMIIRPQAVWQSSSRRIHTAAFGGPLPTEVRSRSRPCFPMLLRVSPRTPHSFGSVDAKRKKQSSAIWRPKSAAENRKPSRHERCSGWRS